MSLRNPILPGFNPDPSICRVGADFYIATSTFEWYPGVQIHHSRDLESWDIVTRPLERVSQLDMRGNPDSCGIWAPCLSYADGLFWLIYTDVKRLDGNYKDAHNYLVTAPTIEGPWSDRVYMNSSGFDPSLFHDDDGRKWFVNMQWNHRSPGTGGNPAHPSFDGILLQEYVHGEGLVGPITNIFDGSPLGLTEAPHLYKRDGWYYLITAEGGTGYSHAVTNARSRKLEGPYELHPDVHPLTTRDARGSPLQRVGHGQFVELEGELVAHTFLCSRPLPNKRSPLGRETGLDFLRWDADGWLRRPDGSSTPLVCPRGEAALHTEDVTYRFETALPKDFQWLRTPEPDRVFEVDGCLRLIGRESIGSWFEQSLVARRQTHLRYSAETSLLFAPECYQQMAGLVTYYNRHKFHYLCVSCLEGQRVLTIQSCPGDWPESRLDFPVGEGIAIEDGPVQLGVDVTDAEMQFRFRQAGAWQPIGPILDASVLSDEGGRGEHASFTGNFVGMACQDITGRALPAEFDYFRYQGTD